MTKFFNAHKRHDKISYQDSYLILSLTSCWKVNAAVYNVICALDQSGTREEYLRKLRELNCKNPEEFLANLCEKGILRERASYLKQIWQFITGPKICVLKGSWLNRISRPEWLNMLFSPATMWMGMLLFAVTMAWFYFMVGPLHWNSISYFWLFLGILSHEVGHSAACAYLGVGFRPIGITWYLLWPIAFTNVSGVDLLNTRQRFLVNLSGMYLQGLMMVLLFFVGLLWPGSGTNASIKILGYLILINLNPFIMSDGYWCFQDSLKTEGKARWQRAINFIYQVGYLVFTVWLAYRVGKGTYNFIEKQDFSWQALGAITANQALSTVLLLYLQILILKGVGGRLIRTVKRHLSAASDKPLSPLANEP